MLPQATCQGARTVPGRPTLLGARLHGRARDTRPPCTRAAAGRRREEAGPETANPAACARAGLNCRIRLCA